MVVKTLAMRCMIIVAHGHCRLSVIDMVARAWVRSDRLPCDGLEVVI